ncbi:restriction endonuclease subunit S [Microbulbifer sp. ZKSA006]|uniref:restriction endonuclease subunit S n=1 Tax=Microbulbifer sp. ZKSA006 TaxID=3243390 RepID=UPI004039D71C
MRSDQLGPLGTIPDGWKIEKLVNLTTKIGSGSTPRGGEAAYLSERDKFAFVRSQNVFDFYFSPSEMKYISDADAKKLRGVHLEKNDILLNITGDGITFARSCIVPKNILPAAVNQHVCIIRVDPKKCLPGYLLAYLCLPQIKDYIANFNAGGSRRAVTKGHIESFEIPIAPIHIQEYVQKITIDFIKKIELNRQTNQTLEQIAQALFKSWFVDFEPTRAKIAANQAAQLRQQGQCDSEILNKIQQDPRWTSAQAAIIAQGNPEQAAIAALNGGQAFDSLNEAQQTQLKTTAALFPDMLVNSDLGDIPEGWPMETIGNLFELHRGFDLPKKNRKEGDYPVFSAGGYHGCHTEFKMEPPGIITGRSGVIGNVYLSLENYWPLNTTLYVRKFKKCGPYYTYFFLSQIDLKSINSGSAVPSLNRNFVHSLPCVLPSNEILEAFEKIAKPFFSKIKKNDEETTQLSEIRDQLLPKLLSNEVKAHIKRAANA